MTLPTDLKRTILFNVLDRHDGEMVHRMQCFDWTATPLGPPERWSQTLKTLTDLMLGSQQPMFMAWGREQTWLYNDAFIPILGQKHPWALGRPAMEVWSEARADLEPLFDQVFSGRPVRSSPRSPGWGPTSSCGCP